MKILPKDKKAFTLIELMIVVVVLWVLMATVLPKLTGAQARARDAARIADLNNISNALVTYYDDEWMFPWSWSWECLQKDTWISSQINSYLQNNVVPTDPQSTSNKWLCDGNTWRYYYYPMVKDSLDNNAFVLCADMETYQKANTDAALLVWTDASATTAPTYIAAPAESTWDSDLDYDDAADDVNQLWTTTEKEEADQVHAWHTVYCILRP